MKIGYLTSTYLPKLGGAEIFTHNLAKRIAASGHDATVMTPWRGGANDKIFKYKVVRLNPLLNRLLFINFGLGKRYLEKILSRLQEKHGFDIWHVIVGYPLGAAAVDFFNRNEIPCVLRSAGEDIQLLPELNYGYRLNKKVDRIVRDNYKKFSALVAASEGMRRDYLALGVPEDKVFVIPNGADCARFDMDVDRRKIRSELGVSDRQTLIITVGRNHPKKGFKYIPKIIKELLKKGADFKWLLVGRDCEAIKRLADEEGVGRYLIVKNVKSGTSIDGEPEVPDNELIRYYKASDIFAFPTLIELFAKVLIEAIAAGLPIVTTDAPGAGEIIRDNENGLKTKAGDIKGMSESIFKLISEKGMAKRLGENALRDARNYDWPRITDMYTQLYRQLLHANDKTSRIKVAHIITDLDIGGAEMMLLKTLRNFKNEKYEHLVISLKPVGKMGEMFKAEGFKIYSLNLNIYNSVSGLMKLLSILRKEKPHIAHNYLFHADILGRIAAKAAGIPIVISSLRSVEIGGRLREILLSITDFCVDGVTAVSKAVANAHISKGTTKRKKIRLIYNGVELENNRFGDASLARRSTGIEEGTFLLLTVGRAEEVKGHTFLFDALRTLKDRGYKFKLLAVGRGEEKLRGDIAKRRLENEVILTGEKEDISELLTASDAFVLPSLWDGMPNALLEAMAAGLPAVATRVGGIPEVITDNETGLLVESKDSNAIAGAIERIMREKGLRERLARNAKNYTRENFDIKKTVSGTRELYEGLLRGHGKD